MWLKHTLIYGIFKLGNFKISQVFTLLFKFNQLKLNQF